MGHKGSMEAKYTTNKAQLSQSLENEMRNAFKQSEEFLDREALIENEEERMKEDIRTQVAAMTPEQLSHIQELLKNWKAVEAVKDVTGDEAESLINGGWEYVGVLPNQKVIIKANSPSKQM